MTDMDSDTAMRMAAFTHIKKLLELRDVLTADDLAAVARFREANQSHASDSPVPGERRSTNSPAEEEDWTDTRMPMRYGERVLAARGGMAKAAKEQGRG
jgi:hypothetical protein